MEKYSDIGNTIKFLRKKIGLSQKKLAQISGLSFNNLVNIEAGKNKNPGIKFVHNLAQSLNVKVDDLLQDQKKDIRKFAPLYQRDLPPLPILLLCNAYTKNLEEILSDKWTTILLTIKNGYASFYFDVEELARLGKKCFALASKDHDFLGKIHDHFLILAKKFIHQTHVWQKENLNRLSNKKLIALISDYCRDYQRVSPYGEIVPFSLESYLTEKLHAYLGQKFVGISESEKTEVFSTLSAFTKTSFIAQEELDLYRIALKHRREQNSLLEEHCEKYLWVPFDYIGPAWNLEYFKKRLLEINALDTNEIRKKVFDLENQGQQTKERQKIITKKYHFKESEIWEFGLLQECALLYDTKKEYLTQSHYHFSFLLREIARRLKINFELIYYALPEELMQSLDENILSNMMLLKRKQSSFLLHENGITKYLNDQEAKSWLPQMEGHTTPVSETEASGLAASSGNVKAKISKILFPRHIGNMRKGDILLTTMTSVDFLPAMRMASAIVTELGGITSHAAIVSRELGIPCIVGVKNATKIFEDGDRAEVNAEKGKIILLKR